jgi:ribosome-associated toxin RatA of RatAB toxin-antitoxin module
MYPPQTQWLAASLLAAMTLARPAGAAAWPLDATQRAAVERGEILVIAARDDAPGGRGAATARAALRIAAPPDKVFDVMTDCASAARWVPRMLSCEVIESDPARSMELIAHRVDYGWYAPRIDYVFRARYEGRRRIAFDHVSGDLEANDGAWELERAADGVSTVVTYTVRTKPAFYLPQWLYLRGVQAEIPALLRALRARAEQ